MIAQRADDFFERRHTPEEYLAFEETAEWKHEYVEGRIRAMPAVSAVHDRIVSNLTGTLSLLLRQTPYHLHTAAMRLAIPARRRYTYADATVTLAAPAYEGAANASLLNPAIVFEVLSPASEAYDRGAKFAAYRQASSVREYVVIAQDQPRIEHYQRRGDGWLLTIADTIDGAIELPSIGCTLPLQAIYDRVALPPEPLAQTDAASGRSAAERASGRLCTPAEYLAIDRADDWKNEYIGGRIVRMPHVGPWHVTIAGNVLTSLHHQLRDTRFDVFAARMRVKVEASGDCFFPDVVVAASTAHYEHDYVDDTLLTPVVIAEVFTPEPAAYDQNTKFSAYRQAPSLREYLLIAQDRSYAEHYVRQREQWRRAVANDLDGEVELPTIGCCLSLRDIYQRVEFPGARSDDGGAAERA